MSSSAWLCPEQLRGGGSHTLGEMPVRAPVKACGGAATCRTCSGPVCSCLLLVVIATLIFSASVLPPQIDKCRTNWGGQLRRVRTRGPSALNLPQKPCDVVFDVVGPLIVVAIETKQFRWKGGRGPTDAKANSMWDYEKKSCRSTLSGRIHPQRPPFASVGRSLPFHCGQSSIRRAKNPHFMQLLQGDTRGCTYATPARGPRTGSYSMWGGGGLGRQGLFSSKNKAERVQ